MLQTIMALLVAATAVAVPSTAGARSGPAVVTYEVRGRGQAGDLEAFAAVADAVYADSRGWSEGARRRFERVTEGGHFTLWLAADAEMASFGGACDRVWSCRNGRNVVINEDRWLGASPAWNEAGASLADYRHMVLNHETGHWLGHGHALCPGPGERAPVMQQQSMALGGCRPNPWPFPARSTDLGRGRCVTRMMPLREPVPCLS